MYAATGGPNVKWGAPIGARPTAGDGPASETTAANVEPSMNWVSTHICSAAQPRILFGRGQSVTSSVADVFLTVESWHEAPVKIIVCLFFFICIVMEAADNLWNF